MNLMTGKDIKESIPVERTALTYLKTTCRILIFGLMQSAKTQTEEYVRPDPPKIVAMLSNVCHQIFLKTKMWLMTKEILERTE